MFAGTNYIPARGRPPHGARGLKSPLFVAQLSPRRRAPHGARGLKSLAVHLGPAMAMSRPARGAWIEIRPQRCGLRIKPVAPRTGRVD